MADKSFDVGVYFKTHGLNKLQGGVNKLKTAFSGMGSIMTNFTRIAGRALIGFATDTMNLTKDFEVAITQVGVTAGATEEEFALLKEAAMEAGETTRYTALESADALNQLASAGFGVAGSIELLPTVLNAASAGNMTLEQSSKLATSAIKGFGLDISEAESIMDKMLVTTQVSSLRMTELSNVLSNLSAKAVTFQGHIEGFEGTLLAMAGALKDTGVSAGKAGTDIGRLLERVEAVSKDSKQENIITGLFGSPKAFFDAQGNAKDILDIVDMFSDKFSEAMSGKDIAKQIGETFRGVSSNFTTVFETTEDRIGALKVLYQGMPDQLAKLMNDIESKTGQARDVFVKQTLQDTTKMHEAFANLSSEQQAGMIVQLMGDNEEAVDQFFNTLGKWTQSDILPTLKDLFGARAISTFATIMNTGTDSIREDAAKINEANGQLREAAEKFNQTLEGQKQLFKSAWQGFQLRLGDELNTTVKETMGGLKDFLFGTDVEIPVYVSGIGEVQTQIKHTEGLLDKIDIKAIGEGIKNALSWALEFINKITSALEKVDFGIDWSLIAGVINTIADIITGTIIPAIAKIAPVVGEFVNKLVTIFNKLKPIIDIIIEVLINAFGKALEFINPLLDVIISLIEPLQKVFEAWQKVWNAFLEGDWDGLVTALGEYFQAIWDFIVQLFSKLGVFLYENVILPIQNMFEGLWSAVTSRISNWWDNNVVPFFSSIGQWFYDNVIMPIVNFFVFLWDSVTTSISNFWDNTTSFFSTVGSWFYDNVIMPIANFFTQLWETITTGISEWWNSVVEFLAPIATWIYDNIIKPVVDFFVGMWDNIVEGMKRWWDMVTGIFTPIATWVYDNVITPVIDFFVEMGQGIYETFMKIVNKVKEIFGNIVKAISGAIEKVKEFLGWNNKASEKATETWNKVNNLMSKWKNTLEKMGGADGSSGYKPGVQEFAMGGLVTGASYPQDTIPAMLTGGEFVVNKDATDRFLPLLQAINENKETPIFKFANGGLVTGANTNVNTTTPVKTNNVTINSINVTMKSSGNTEIDVDKFVDLVKDRLAEEIGALL